MLKVTAAIVFLFVLAVPTAHAATTPFFGPIISPACNCLTPINANGVTAPTSAPGWGCVLDTFQRTINLGISLAVVFMTFLIAFAGFSYIWSRGNPEGRSLANKRIMNAAIGLLIALGAFLLVDSLMKAVYNPSNAAFGPWNSILGEDQGAQCIAPSKPPSSFAALNTPANGTGGTGSAQVSAVQTNTASGNEGQVRAQLAGASVSINHDACTSGSSGTGCTNVGGLQQDTIQQIINMSDKCGNGPAGCGLVVSGGSEPGHATGSQYTHGNGYKVDIRLGTQLDGIIKKFTYGGTRLGDAPGVADPFWTDKCGNQYVQEASLSHWDITVYRACAL